MIIVMNNSATEEHIENVLNKIKEKGLEGTVSKGTEKTVIGAVGDERLRNEFRDKDGVNGCPVLELLQFGLVADVGAEEDLPRREEDIIAITSEGTLIKGMK